MFAPFTFISVFLAAAAVYVRADPNPNNPGPGDVFVEGSSCQIGWDVDTTGLWKVMNIDLMTGNNYEMVFLTNVGTADGTDPTKNTFSYVCPQVTPHSAIYFYQFSSPAAPNKTWTGRFTITNPAHDIVPPSQSTQPDGEKIPWGTGALANASSTTVPSSVSASSSANGTQVTTTASATPSTTMSPSTMSTLRVVTTAVIATPSAVPTTGTSGAAATFSASNTVFQTGLVLGLVAFGFAVTF